jgi:hypothetical protein
MYTIPPTKKLPFPNKCAKDAFRPRKIASPPSDRRIESTFAAAGAIQRAIEAFQGDNRLPGARSASARTGTRARFAGASKLRTNPWLAALRDMRSLHALVEISGRPTQPKFGVATNLGPQLASGLRDALATEVAAQRTA